MYHMKVDNFSYPYQIAMYHIERGYLACPAVVHGTIN